MAAYRTALRDSLSEPDSYRLPLATVTPARHHLPSDTTAFSCELMLAAQRCTDPLSVLNELFDRVNQYLPVDGVAWRQGHDEIYTQNFTTGTDFSSPAQWVELTHVDDVRLGKLGVSAERVLSASELAWLHQVAQSIAFSLRNSMLYQRALSEAQQDPLTCLKNRRAFDAQLVREHAQCVRYGIKSSLVAMDLNNFKSINDTWGHDVGDRLLKLFATGLSQILRETDHAFRFGGDEFCAILPATNAYGAKKMTDRLNAWLGQHELQLQSGEQISIRTAFGGAESESGGDERDWFRRADQSLYDNKRALKRVAA
ncbi:MAG: GGDEF domain-containing protein [Halothiobacillus sp.]